MWKQTNEKKKEAFDAVDKGELQRAIDLFTEAIELNPQSANLYVCRASTFLKLRMPHAAISDCNQLDYDENTYTMLKEVEAETQSFTQCWRKHEEKCNTESFTEKMERMKEALVDPESTQTKIPLKTPKHQDTISEEQE
uniref:Uncharacterized protein n=1 Tax=Podarcis muralis TaxID=64176 RepID=A0A670JPK4_PODMU